MKHRASHIGLQPLSNKDFRMSSSRVMMMMNGFEGCGKTCYIVFS